MLFMQTRVMLKLTGIQDHPAVRDSYRAAVKLVKAIHEIEKCKGKYIYVGTWNSPLIKGEGPHLDFITVNISAEEVLRGKLDIEEWREKVEAIRGAFGNITILAVLEGSYRHFTLSSF